MKEIIFSVVPLIHRETVLLLANALSLEKPIYFNLMHSVNPITNNVLSSFLLPESLETYLRPNFNKYVIIYDLNFLMY